MGHAIRAFNRLPNLLTKSTRPGFKRSKASKALRCSNPANRSRMTATVPSHLFSDDILETRLTIFDGAHEIILSAAIDWLSQQKDSPAFHSLSREKLNRFMHCHIRLDPVKKGCLAG